MRNESNGSCQDGPSVGDICDLHQLDVECACWPFACVEAKGVEELGGRVRVSLFVSICLCVFAIVVARAGNPAIAAGVRECSPQMEAKDLQHERSFLEAHKLANKQHYRELAHQLADRSARMVDTGNSP